MLPDMNTTTVALLFLLVVLSVAAISTRTVAIIVSLVAFVCFNFFFPPAGQDVRDCEGRRSRRARGAPCVSLIGSHLSHQSRERGRAALALAQEANEAEIARRNADAKAALVSSISHDLKTPLTALTVSAGNLGTPGLSEEERREQLRLVQTELARLKRLFDSIIDMASVETRSLTAELEWVHPADIVEAACQHAEARFIPVRLTSVTNSGDQVVHLDPRITSAALAHVLENAAMYSAVPSPVSIHIERDRRSLAVAVR
jgi:K+-sensing histidine kinase KdpD